MDEFNNSKQPKQIELLWRDRVQRHINSGKSPRCQGSCRF